MNEQAHRCCDLCYLMGRKDGPPWISVKDRMPDKDSTVLIYTEAHDTYMAKIYKDGEAWPISNSCGCCGTEEKFTHWMPLPQPPKEEV